MPDETPSAPPSYAAAASAGPAEVCLLPSAMFSFQIPVCKLLFFSRAVCLDAMVVTLGDFLWF